VTEKPNPIREEEKAPKLSLHIPINKLAAMNPEERAEAFAKLKGGAA
jgi:hypothetical protein